MATFNNNNVKLIRIVNTIATTNGVFVCGGGPALLAGLANFSEIPRLT